MKPFRNPKHPYAEWSGGAAAPDLIGSVWTAREYDEASPWPEVRVTGVLDLGEVRGIEVTVTSAVDFTETTSTTVDSLVDKYTREVDADDPAEKVQRTLQQILQAVTTR
jgi:hypothetical protein